MAKLTRDQARNHAKAVEILKQDVLTWEDKLFVLHHWQEGANHVNGDAGAFFTPEGLAGDFAIEVCGPRILDLCAGIGALAFWAFHYGSHGRERPRELVCVEINPDYIEVGRKILPEATWIQGDVFNLPADLGRFDCVIGNPPFGKVKRTGSAPRYTGAQFELAVIDIGSDYAPYGVFIVPQTSAGFAYSGVPNYQERQNDKTRAFRDQTKITLGANCGIDCAFYKDDWHGVAPIVEIVTADFDEARAARSPRPVLAPVLTFDNKAAAPAVQGDLFSREAA